MSRTSTFVFSALCRVEPKEPRHVLKAPIPKGDNEMISDTTDFFNSFDQSEAFILPSRLCEFSAMVHKSNAKDTQES